MKSKVIGAMAYPVFLAVTGFVVLNILVIFFVPRFKPVFAKLEEKGELALRHGRLAFDGRPSGRGARGVGAGHGGHAGRFRL